jgi:hypothetical protein
MAVEAAARSERGAAGRSRVRACLVTNKRILYERERQGDKMPISLIYLILSLRERELGVGTSASGPRWDAVNCSCSPAAVAWG